MRSMWLLTIALSSSVNGLSSLSMDTCCPNATVSRLNMSFDHIPPVTNFPDNTQIAPVTEPGRATLHRSGAGTLSETRRFAHSDAVQRLPDRLRCCRRASPRVDVEHARLRAFVAR